MRIGRSHLFSKPDARKKFERLIRIESDDFIRFDKPNYAKAVWNFSFDETDGSANRLTTETRVFCTDARSRLRFRLYWFFIGWFSGLIRREMLGVIKAAAEENYRRQQNGEFSPESL